MYGVYIFRKGKCLCTFTFLIFLEGHTFITLSVSHSHAVLVVKESWDKSAKTMAVDNSGCTYVAGIGKSATLSMQSRARLAWILHAAYSLLIVCIFAWISVSQWNWESVRVLGKSVRSIKVLGHVVLRRNMNGPTMSGAEPTWVHMPPWRKNKKYLLLSIFHHLCTLQIIRSHAPPKVYRKQSGISILYFLKLAVANKLHALTS